MRTFVVGNLGLFVPRVVQTPWEAKVTSLRAPTGYERAAAIYSLIGAAKLKGMDPEAYLRHVIGRLDETSCFRSAGKAGAHQWADLGGWQDLPWRCCARSSVRP